MVQHDWLQQLCLVKILVPSPKYASDAKKLQQILLQYFISFYMCRQLYLKV